MRYLVPKHRTTTETRVRNSRFRATLDRVESVAAAKELLAELRRAHPEANHHVYAFIVGFGASITEGLSDDGEPSGTSGPPVMAVLRGAGIGDAILVVTRFFGGTRLGTGGLVSAYKEAAQTVLAAAEIEEKVERKPILFSLDYSLLEQVKRRFDDFELTAPEIEYGAEVLVRGEIAVEKTAEFQEFLGEISAGRSRVRISE